MIENLLYRLTIKVVYISDKNYIFVFLTVDYDTKSIV